MTARQLSLDLVKGAPKAATVHRSAQQVPYTLDQIRREQAAARAGAYIGRWLDCPIGTRSLERAEQALREALEP